MFYTIRIQDVTILRDNDENSMETVKDITQNLILPHALSDLIAKCENFTAAATSTEPTSAPVPEKS